MTALGARYRLEDVALRSVRAIVGRLPDAVSWRIGALIGLGFFWIDAPHRRLAIRQLQTAFPLRSAAECRAIARQTFIHFGQLAAVLIKFSTLTREGILARVDYEGVERVRAAAEAGKGVILSSGHFGFWEMQAIAHPLVLPPMQLLARPLDKLEDRGLDYRRRLRDGYRAEAARDPRRIAVIDAAGGVADVQAAVRAAILERFSELR